MLSDRTDIGLGLDTVKSSNLGHFPTRFNHKSLTLYIITERPFPIYQPARTVGINRNNSVSLPLTLTHTHHTTPVSYYYNIEGCFICWFVLVTPPNTYFQRACVHMCHVYSSILFYHLTVQHINGRRSFTKAPSQEHNYRIHTHLLRSIHKVYVHQRVDRILRILQNERKIYVIIWISVN